MLGPKGSSTKEDPLGAAGKPARGFSYSHGFNSFIQMMMNITDHIKNPLIQRIAAGLAGILGAALVIISLNKSVFLILNGKLEQYETNALTIKGFLSSQDLFPDTTDRLSPELGSLLWGNEIIILEFSNQIQIEADGKVLDLDTAEINTSNVLLEAGLLLYPKDRIVVNGMSATKGTTLSLGKDHNIQLFRATRIDLHVDTGVLQFITGEEILEKALAEEGIEIFEADQLSSPLETFLDGTALTVELIRAKPLTVHLADKSLTIRTTADTVGGALASAGLALQGLDYSKPPENEPLPENDQIQIIRVEEEILLKQDQIPFTSEYQAANNLELDQLQILSGGEYGLSAQRLRITYENGIEISRDLDKEWIVKEPEPRVIGYGTQINIQTANTPDGQITYWRKITAWATSYDSTCPGCDTITSSGTVLKKGTVAVRLDWYRYMKFAQIYIPGYGFGRIEDVGGGVPWSVNWVDLGYKKDEYVPWSENVTVYFLAPAPPPENIMYILY